MTLLSFQNQPTLLFLSFHSLYWSRAPNNFLGVINCSNSTTTNLYRFSALNGVEVIQKRSVDDDDDGNKRPRVCVNIKPIGRQEIALKAGGRGDHSTLFSFITSNFLLVRLIERNGCGLTTPVYLALIFISDPISTIRRGWKKK